MSETEQSAYLAFDNLTMVIPNGYPRKLLMAGQEVEIRAVGRQSLAVIIQRVNLAVRQRHPTNTLSPAVSTILIFVYIVAEMNDIVDGVFADRISVCIEEAKS